MDVSGGWEFGLMYEGETFFELGVILEPGIGDFSPGWISGNVKTCEHIYIKHFIQKLFNQIFGFQRFLRNSNIFLQYFLT